MHRIVFTIDGQQRLALPAGLGRDQLSGRHQAFFVREADRLAGFDGFVRCLEFGHAESAPANRAGRTQDGNTSHAESLSYAGEEGGASYTMVPWANTHHRVTETQRNPMQINHWIGSVSMTSVPTRS